MQTKYKVKLLDGHSALPNQIVGGYLGNTFDNGRIERYTRGEAIKKAKRFGGEIEEIPTTISFDEMKMATIDENVLIHGVEVLVKEFDPAFNDATKGNQVIYPANIFEQLLNDNERERSAMSKKIHDQLEELADAMEYFQYVVITNSN